MWSKILFVTSWLCCLPTLASAATSHSLHIEWGYTPPSEPAVVGFNLYQEGVLACQARESTATAMDCQVTLSVATTSFTLTAVFSDDTESPHSAPFLFTTPSEPKAALTAIITTAPLGGTAPVTITFDASTSTGAFATCQWDFGNGTTTTGTTATHSYTVAGDYVVRLTISSTMGQTSTATTTVTITAAETAVPSPTPVIFSSTAAGKAPLVVTFDGSGSTAAANATLTAHSWSFGDGAIATGTSVSHSFMVAGTYTTTLTVTDSQGQIGSVTIPVVVTTAVAANRASDTATVTTPTTFPKTNADNGNSSLDSSEDSFPDLVQQLYVGYLGRPADQEGLNYWVNEIATGTLTLEQLRANLTNEQPEYRNIYGNLTRTDLVIRIYRNLFKREPDYDGVAYWERGDGARVRTEQLILAFINAASDPDRQVFENKVLVANSYTTKLGEVAKFNFEEAVDLIDQVDGTDASVMTALAAIDALIFF